MVNSLSSDTLVSHYPTLYHMAEAGSWHSIQRHGLLSTTALLDLFEIGGSARSAIESCHRPECVTITHPHHGTAVVRDQLPMSDSGLEKALRDGLRPSDWYRILNAKVFFWVSEDRLNTLLSARAYRDRRQTVIFVDTAGVVRDQYRDIRLSPYNSGSTKPNPFPRGLDTFLPVEDYPFESWRRKRSRRKAVVELTVEYSVPEVARYALLVKEVGGGLPERIVWQRD